MERRRLLQAGLALGATYVGEQLRPLEAEARPLKLARTFYEGTIGTVNSYYSARLRLAVVSKRVIGFGSIYLGSQDVMPALMFVGKVKGKTLKAEVTLVYDPQDRVPPGTVVGTIKGTVSGTKVKGKLDIPGLPDSQGGTTGKFEGARIVEDKEATREFAGVYDGEVVAGLPEFKAEATLGANGTYTLSNIRRPDGSAVPGRRGGVFLLSPPVSPGSEERVVYSLPLPSIGAGAGNSEVAGALSLYLCDSCLETGEENKTKADRKQAQVAGTGTKAGNQVTAYQTSGSPGGNLALQGTRR